MPSSFGSLRATTDAAELEARRTLQLREHAPAKGGPVPRSTKPAGNAAELILGLQQTAGNAAVAQLLRASTSGAAGVRAPTVQRSGDDEESTVEADDETTVEPGEPLSTPMAGGDAGAAAGVESASTDPGEGGTSATEPTAAGGGETATGAPDTAAAGDTATAGPDTTTADGETAGADPQTAGDEGESSPAADPATGDAASAGGRDGEPAANADGGADAGDADGEHSQEDQDTKEAEGESFTDVDERVPMEGGPPPSSPVAIGRFIDGGRAGTVPFETRTSRELGAEDALVPHAYVGGGRTGGAAWSGGGPGRGPKGNQGTGSLQVEVEPKYDTRSNGLTGDADAWVMPGTGLVDVKRDYIASDAGDQGNGWWISSRAAASLEAHEQRHVTAAKEDYDNKLQPMLDRVAKSESLGKGLAYWSSKATFLLKQKIGWKYALEQFKEADQQSNANQGVVDLNDYGTSHYPRNMKGPRKIAGKDYDNYLIMGDESDPT